MRRALEGEARGRGKNGRYERGATFHDRVVAAADNPFLEEAFNLAAGRIELVSRQATVRSATLPKGARHEDILAAIERGQPEAAERAMRAHLSHHLQELIEHLT
jgi:DNA-binding GntR family transcriptional regulator